MCVEGCQAFVFGAEYVLGESLGCWGAVDGVVQRSIATNCWGGSLEFSSVDDWRFYHGAVVDSAELW